MLFIKVIEIEDNGVKDEMNAQGTVEYMALIASVIAFSVIIISMMLNNVNTGADSMIQESKGYWAKRVPISILEWRQGTDGSVYFIMKNKGLEAITFYNISLDGYVIGSETDVPINGEFVITGNTHTCNKGDLIEYTQVTIRYKPKGSDRVLEKVESHPIRMMCT